MGDYLLEIIKMGTKHRKEMIEIDEKKASWI